MLAEWTADCTEHAPTLVVPWADPATGVRFVNLRAEPYEIAEIPEAERWPTLARALRSLNATRSPLLTAKCDAWAFPADEATTDRDHLSSDILEALRLELDADPEASHAAFGSYIDLLWRDRALFASAHQQQERLDRVVRRAQRLDHPHTKLECVLRPAVLDGAIVLEGFAVSLYLYALGPDAATALRQWELALEDTVELLRSREFEVPRGSATIEPA
jgi:hypothetical protein